MYASTLCPGSPASPPFPTITSGSLRAMTDDNVVVYHNPVCSKARGAVEILGEKGADVEVIEYLKVHPSRGRPRAHRRRDPRPAGGAGAQGQAVQRARARRGRLPDEGAGGRVLLEHPELMERPVVFVGERAVISRPSEKVLELLD